MRCKFVNISCFLLGISITLSACRKDADDTTSCFINIENKRYFLGTEDCMKNLPTRKMSGFLSYGFERSVIYNSLKDAQKNNGATEDKVWLYLDNISREKVKSDEYKGKNVIYRIEFMGSANSSLGLYGHMGQYGGGAIVKKMISMEKVDS